MLLFAFGSKNKEILGSLRYILWIVLFQRFQIVCSLLTQILAEDMICAPQNAPRTTPATVSTKTPTSNISEWPCWPFSKCALGIIGAAYWRYWLILLHLHTQTLISGMRCALCLFRTQWGSAGPAKQNAWATLNTSLLSTSPPLSSSSSSSWSTWWWLSSSRPFRKADRYSNLKHTEPHQLLWVKVPGDGVFFSPSVACITLFCCTADSEPSQPY